MLIAQSDFLALSTEEQERIYAESLAALGPCPEDDGKMYNDHYAWQSRHGRLPAPYTAWGFRILIYAAAACYQYGLYNQILATELMTGYERGTGLRFTFHNGKYWKDLAHEKARKMSENEVLYQAVTGYGIMSVKGFPTSAIYCLLSRTDYDEKEQSLLRSNISTFLSMYGDTRTEAQPVVAGASAPEQQPVAWYWRALNTLGW